MADLIPIPAITIWQPWATLIMEGAKRFEFRSWPSPSRYWDRRVAIHAGARFVKAGELRALLAKLQSPHYAETAIDPAIAVPIIERVLNAPKSLPLASVLGTVTMGRPMRNERLSEALGVPFVNDSDRDQHSNWGWPVSDPQRMEPPVPARGAQGWWNWNPGEAHG